MMVVTQHAWTVAGGGGGGAGYLQHPHIKCCWWTKWWRSPGLVFNHNLVLLVDQSSKDITNCQVNIHWVIMTKQLPFIDWILRWWWWQGWSIYVQELVDKVVVVTNVLCRYQEIYC